ncbi:hypothetical protein ACIXN0_21350 [Bacteroides fragilis]
MVYTRASADDEQAIRSLGVFIVKPDGNLAEGITRFYEAKALTDKKTCRFYPGRHNGNSRYKSLPGG